MIEEAAPPVDFTFAMPRFNGHPLYPGGIPVAMDNVFLHGRSVRQIFYGERGDDSLPTLTEEEEAFVKAYVLYYINAPLFIHPSMHLDMENDALQKLSLDHLVIKCLECGIDPL